MPETSPNRQGWLIKPPPPMVASSSTKHSFFPSQSHIPPKIKPEKVSTSLLPDSLQTLTLTFSDLGLKSIKFSLKHPILSKPQPLLSLWSGSKKGARVWGSRSLVPFFLCFFLWVWVGYTGSDDDGVEGEAESVDVERVVEARVWGSRSLVPFFLCFYLWVWVRYAGSGDDGVEGEAESVDVERVVEAQSGLREWSAGSVREKVGWSERDERSFEVQNGKTEMRTTEHTERDERRVLKFKMGKLKWEQQSTRIASLDWWGVKIRGHWIKWVAGIRGIAR